MRRASRPGTASSGRRERPQPGVPPKTNRTGRRRRSAPRTERSRTSQSNFPRSGSTWDQRVSLSQRRTPPTSKPGMRPVSVFIVMPKNSRSSGLGARAQYGPSTCWASGPSPSLASVPPSTLPSGPPPGSPSRTTALAAAAMPRRRAISRVRRRGGPRREVADAGRGRNSEATAGSSCSSGSGSPDASSSARFQAEYSRSRSSWPAPRTRAIRSTAPKLAGTVRPWQ